MRTGMRKRVLFAISGASGMPLAQTVLRHYAGNPHLEIHLLVSAGAVAAIREELHETADIMTSHADVTYDASDFAAPPASGSWRNDGMIICPCSMATLAAIATGCGTNLVHRAADVTLKERRTLILVPRECPFNLVHLRNMQSAAEAGAVIMPFIPAFYTGDNSMAAAMRQFSGRMLDLLHIPHNLCIRWKDEASLACGE